MSSYLKITGRTITIWFLTSVINGLLCGISLSVIKQDYTDLFLGVILIFFISLFFSMPGFFIFWLVLLNRVFFNITGRALFRAALVTGFTLSAVTAFISSGLFASEFSNHASIPITCIIVSEITSVMLHFKRFKKINLTT